MFLIATSAFSVTWKSSENVTNCAHGLNSWHKTLRHRPKWYRQQQTLTYLINAIMLSFLFAFLLSYTFVEKKRQNKIYKYFSLTSHKRKNVWEPLQEHLWNIVLTIAYLTLEQVSKIIISFFNPPLAPRKVFFFQLISYIKNLTMIKGSGLKSLVLYRGGKKKWERSRCRLPRLKINTLPSLRKLDGIAKWKSGESSLSRARSSSHKLTLIPDNER